MSAAPTVAVVVCAYTVDRFSDIDRAITSLRRQSLPPQQIVLVVDHNDVLLHQLRQHARRYWADLTGLEILPSDGPRGLSGARNTGVARCQTDILAFLDDDAAARTDWLAALCVPYADATVVATGGRAVPTWTFAGAPVMLPPELLWVVGCTYEGQPTVRADVRNVMGCSMSFRASALAEAGGFADGVGRTAELPLGCEETELCIRITALLPGARIVFEPAAVVDHRVGAERCTWGYLLRRSLAEGRSKAAISRLVGAQAALSTERAYTRSVLPRGIARELRAHRWPGAAAIVVSLGAAALGYLRGRLSPGPSAAGTTVGAVAAAVTAVEAA